MRFMFHRTKVLLAIISCFLLTSCGGEVKEFKFSLSAPKNWESLVAEGKVHKDKGNFAEAEKCYKEAIDHAVSKFGENDARTGTCVGYLAGLFMDRQDWKLAYDQYKRWRDIMKEVDPDGDQLKQIESDLGKCKEKMKQYGLVPDEVLKKRQEKALQEGSNGDKKPKKDEKGKGKDKGKKKDK